MLSVTIWLSLQAFSSARPRWSPAMNRGGQRCHVSPLEAMCCFSETRVSFLTALTCEVGWNNQNRSRKVKLISGSTNRAEIAAEELSSLLREISIFGHQGWGGDSAEPPRLCCPAAAALQSLQDLQVLQADCAGIEGFLSV